MWPALYPWTILAAVLAAGVLGRRYPSRLDGRERLGIGLGAFVGAMLGAKLPFVLTDPAGLVSGAAWFSDGKTILTGLVGGYLGVEIAKAALGVRLKTGDGVAVPVAVAVAIGRLGCLMAGCCLGRPTASGWGVDFGDGVRRHPVQLYEFAFHLSAALLLEALYRRGRCRGQLIKLYILIYLGARFLLEFVRPEPPLWLDLTAYQWLCLALAPIFIALWWRDARDFRAGRLEVARIDSP